MIFVGLVIVIAFGLISYTNSHSATAGLKVETIPPALVFVDNVQIGLTPIEKTFSPKEVTVKIVPNSVSPSLPTYQTQVTLSDGVYTVIRRDFGLTDLESAGETVALIPQSGTMASLSVNTSSPDYASLTLDGQPQGLTPLSLTGITPGDHQITISAPGYTPRTISAQALAGYKLSLTVKLAGHSDSISPSPLPLVTSATASATPFPSPAVPSVRILSTPTGFLRVRSGPSASFSEIGQVKPEEIYPYTDFQNDWYLITADMDSTSSGWVSAQYLKKL